MKADITRRNILEKQKELLVIEKKIIDKIVLEPGQVWLNIYGYAVLVVDTKYYTDCNADDKIHICSIRSGLQYGFNRQSDYNTFDVKRDMCFELLDKIDMSDFNFNKQPIKFKGDLFKVGNILKGNDETIAIVLEYYKSDDNKERYNLLVKSKDKKDWFYFVSNFYRETKIKNIYKKLIGRLELNKFLKRYKDYD